MRRITVLLLLLVAVSTAGCRMMKGLGKDIEHGSDTTKDKIDDVIH
jgi:predicted small secreted protein